MKTEFVYRLGKQADCEAIAAIYAPYVTTTAVSFEEQAPTHLEIWNRMQKAFEKHLWLVCELNGVLIGFAYAGHHRERKAYQWLAEVSIYVADGFHKKGIATGLYARLHSILKEQGFVQTYAGMTLPNPASQGFHKRFGYEEFAVYENSGFKFDQWHSTGWMKRQLRELPEKPDELKHISELDPEWLEDTLKNRTKEEIHVE